jgi:hypothetical protein
MKTYLTDADKRAIMDNQQEMVNILGTEDLVKGYNTLISDYGDYDLLADIAPIFERLSDGCYDPVEEVDSVNKEIIDFLYMLPTISVELDLDTFRANLKSYDKLLAFKSNLFEEGLFERLLDSEELTKEEKEKLISIVFNETMKE